MRYEAPSLTEVGSVQGLTLGKLKPGPDRDNAAWYDIWGDPETPQPQGSR
ncbi:lasso RiPP family leader peptide-containing protein [Cellulosimicrobium marinum]|nr:lasso RiPP family leader peptide-containing protein [Cellulosimicrobium marinum]MCB7137058.1 lasso RiPP family leader peptide-containing protein [Cellulosimicrobium marinum]